MAAVARDCGGPANLEVLGGLKYMPLLEAAAIAESSGLQLHWDRSANVPAENESPADILDRVDAGVAIASTAIDGCSSPACVLLVTHADLLMQRLSKLLPGSIWAPDTCAWFVECLEDASVLGMHRLERIL